MIPARLYSGVLRNTEPDSFSYSEIHNHEDKDSVLTVYLETRIKVGLEPGLELVDKRGERQKLETPLWLESFNVRGWRGRLTGGSQVTPEKLGLELEAERRLRAEVSRLGSPNSSEHDTKENGDQKGSTTSFSKGLASPQRLHHDPIVLCNTCRRGCQATVSGHPSAL
ncbi:hypothetical protein ILYODFUR_027687 [Ilyodon furcidens]|uniref:Uncharacterized protein n=1 Tax=Ilyodon furcidens TaxID=33524 RepID=A0ABV0U909_9TELE